MQSIPSNLANDGRILVTRGVFSSKLQVEASPYVPYRIAHLLSQPDYERRIDELNHDLGLISLRSALLVPTIGAPLWFITTVLTAVIMILMGSRCGNFDFECDKNSNIRTVVALVIVGFGGIILLSVLSFRAIAKLQRKIQTVIDGTIMKFNSMDPQLHWGQRLFTVQGYEFHTDSDGRGHLQQTASRTVEITVYPKNSNPYPVPGAPQNYYAPGPSPVQNHIPSEAPPVYNGNNAQVPVLQK